MDVVFPTQSPLLVSFAVYSSAARRLSGGFHSHLCPWTLCYPARKYADQVVMHCFPVLAGRPSEPPLTQEDACGLCRLTQIMSQASELISRECSRKNSWSTWHFIIWMFLLAGSSVSSRVIIMQEYARQNSKKGSCVAVISNFLLCSKFVTLLILLYEPGYLSKANIHCLCQKHEFAFSFPD